MNIDPKNHHGTHWLDFYGLLAGGIELFDLIGYSFSMYSLGYLASLHLFLFFNHIALLYVVITLLFIFIFVFVITHLVTLFIC